MTKISTRELYAAVVQLVIHAETISWSRFNNFLVGGTILIIAWATIFSSNQHSIGSKVTLSAICIVGIFTCIAWSSLGSRSRKYLDEYYSQGEAIEKQEEFWEANVPNELKPFMKTSGIRPEASCYSSSSFLLEYVPWAFAALYAFMFIASWCG